MRDRLRPRSEAGREDAEVSPALSALSSLYEERDERSEEELRDGERRRLAPGSQTRHLTHRRATGSKTWQYQPSSPSFLKFVEANIGCRNAIGYAE